MLESFVDAVTEKNSPDSSTVSCTIETVVQSVLPEVRVKVNVSVMGVKSRNAIDVAVDVDRKSVV